MIWYISFAAEKGSPGACIVNACCGAHARQQAERLGIVEQAKATVPGCEVHAMAIPVPGDEPGPERDPRNQNRLITSEELTRDWGAVMVDAYVAANPASN